MKHAKFNHYVSQLCIGAGLLAGLLLPSAVMSQVLTLPDAPFDGSSTTLKPNFMYVLDNSSSMLLDNTNDAMGTSLQCKNSVKNKNGNTITALSRAGTVLTITESGGTYKQGDFVYLAIPGNPNFSGTYKIATSNYVAGTTGACISWNTSVIINPPTCTNKTYAAGFWTYPTNETPPYYTNPVAACACNGPMVNGGTKPIVTGTGCSWNDPADKAIGTVCTGNAPNTGASGGNVLTVTVLDSGTSVFGASDILDAYILPQPSADTTCKSEPPQFTNQVNSLFYDPTVNYEPPPAPNKITVAAPGNALPSMTFLNTTNWTKVRKDGTKLLASGEPDTTAGNTLNFNVWNEMVYCDTPNKPVAYTSEKLWHESSRCKQNLLDDNKTKLSANYPYQYPALTDGNALIGPDTKFYNTINQEHQFGKAKGTTENPVADLYAFGELYASAKPHYFKINPIEYCDTAQLKNCSFTETAAFKFPSFVRYCKTEVAATNAGLMPAATECQKLYTSTFKYARYGLFERIEVTPKIAPLNVVDKTFFKYDNRTDCIEKGTTFGANKCTYNEEMTNFANWYAYYRTRIQLMKSASAIAFNALGNSYRVGFMTINNPESLANYLPISDFGTSADSPASFSANSNTPEQKRNWLLKLYANAPAGSTPLREALSTAGAIFAGKKPLKALGYTADDPDPMQYACQQNFTLLTTDGYWNGTIGGKQVDGTTAIGNLDGVLLPTTGGTVRPKFDGGNALSTGTLADVAKYYFDTDIRDESFNIPNANPLLDFNSCKGLVAGENVCSPLKGKQIMKTLTLGLGVDGELSYVNDYATTTNAGYMGSDFQKLTAGTLDWPIPVANSPKAVDDLWHAAVNSDGSYFSAKSPKELKESLANAISDIDKALKSGSPAAVSSLEPTAGSDYGFSTSYVAQQWTGNLVARELSASLGSFYQTVAAAPAEWCADEKSVLDLSITTCNHSSDNLSSRVSATGDNGRDIKTKNDDTGLLVDFKYGATGGMSNLQKSYFDAAYLNGKLSQYTSLSAQIVAAGGDSLVKYLRGQNGHENRDPDNAANLRIYRKRSGVLGDITDSNPVHVGKPLFNYSEGKYNEFRDNSNLAAANKTVYVGANDGMLHAFDATNGRERWAYIPSILLPRLHKLADFNYSSGHTNYVNGDPVVGDICVSNCGVGQSGTWKTILVGGLAQGGKGYYALDITDPTAPTLLWEFDSSDDSRLGYSYGIPVITKIRDATPDGTWVVLLTSGYNNGAAGTLFVLKADKGSIPGKAVLLTSIETPTANDNGLAQISGLAINNQTNNQTQYVYGGDLLGNLWKFDIDAASVSLFATVKAGQAITVPPIVIKEQSDTLVLFGTGKLLELSDILTSSTQSLYAIRDDGTETFTDPHNDGSFEAHTFDTDFAAKTRKIDAHIDGAGANGWYVDLDPGERQTVMAQLLGGVLTVPTIVKKGDACSPEGYSWTTQLNYSTGASLDNNKDTNVSTYTDSPITGLVALVKKNASGDKELETTAHTSECIPGSPDCPKVIDPATLLTSGGAFAGKHLIWRELTE